MTRSKRVSHFYHAYADGGGLGIADEHLDALTGAGFDGPCYIGIVGEPENRSAMLAMWLDVYPEVEVVGQADHAWEQLTLHPLREYAIGEAREDGERMILYAHTKGAANPTTDTAHWRRSMQNHVIAGWRWSTEELETGCYDAIGCHWVTAVDFPQYIPPNTEGAKGFFGGNYWMARVDWLAQLPLCDTTTRHNAEAWINQGPRPCRPYDLLEGWPYPEAFIRGGTPRP